MKWYVVVDEYCANPHPDDAVWTISRNSSEPGWNTDSGFCGYGLVRVDAEELANAANEVERLRSALEFYGNPDNWKSGGWDHQFRMMSPEPVYIDKGDKARAALGGDK
jgi:hypothetical protein